jgi:Fur family peroxide stress response transcriptional regulator
MMDRFVRILREGGYKVTPQRLIIYKAVINNREHPTAEEIYEKVKKDYPGLSPATVYKTLALFVKLGIIREYGYEDGINRYDPSTKPHVHLICTNCKKIIDVDLSSIAKVIEEIGKVKDFELKSYRFEFYGICKNCPSGS